MTRGACHIFVNTKLDWCCLEVHGEADQIGAKSKTCALSCGNTDRGRDGVQDGKHDGGQNGQGGNLIQREGLLRDEDRSGGDDQTFDQILNDAINNLSKSVAQHDSFIFTRKKKTCRRTGLVISQAN